MKEVIKNYNYCDLSLNYLDNCVNKNTLSINECVNVSANNLSFKPSNKFDNFFNILGETLYTNFFTKYSAYLNTFIYIDCFNYYDTESLKYKNLYLLIDKSFKLYKLTFSENDSELIDTNITFNKMPIIFNSNGKIYFYSENDKLIYIEDNNLLISVSNFLEFVSFCDFQDQTFFVTKNDLFSVYYTDKTDIENINDDISIYNHIKVDSKYGKILKLINFKNNLYIIQQYSISKIWVVSGNYYIYSNCLINSEILPLTIGKLNDYLIFYSSSGLYLFDGNEFKQIYSSITNKILKNDLLKAVVFNNKYYLYASMFLSGSYKKTLIEFDLINTIPTINIIGDIENIFTIQSMDYYKLCALCKDENNYEILKLNDESFSDKFKYIKFNKILFDDNLTKKIMNIKTISSGDFYLKISSDLTQKIIKVNNNLSISSLGIAGYYFEIEIYSDLYFDIQSISFSIQTITE